MASYIAYLIDGDDEPIPMAAGINRDSVYAMAVVRATKMKITTSTSSIQAFQKPDGFMSEEALIEIDLACANSTMKVLARIIADEVVAMSANKNSEDKK